MQSIQLVGKIFPLLLCIGKTILTKIHCNVNMLIPAVYYSGNNTNKNTNKHYDDVIMTMLAFQITSLTVVYSIVYSGVNQRKHQSSASLAFVREIHRGPVNFPHKWPVTRKMFPFDDVIMISIYCYKQKQAWIANRNRSLHSIIYAICACI